MQKTSFSDSAERRKQSELLAEARRLDKEQEQERGARNSLLRSTEAALLTAKAKEAKAEAVIFLYTQVKQRDKKRWACLKHVFQS